MRSFAFFGLAACASAQLMNMNAIGGTTFPDDTGPDMGLGAVNQNIPYDSKATYQSTYNSVFANGASLPKRSARRSLFAKRHDDGDCSPQPLGSGPSVSPDTPEAFLANPVFAQAANSAVTPNGWVNTFKNLNASSQAPMGYLGYDSVSAYDPAICAAKCDSWAGCFAFDLYFERNPVQDSGVNCPNPASTTVIKCAYWGTTLEEDTATNDGQYCEQFHIVIAGSNGYVRQKTMDQPGYTGTFIGDSAINAPTECNSYIGYQLFNDGKPFDPARCIAACEATSAYNIQYLNGRAICRFIDTYILNKNGVPQGQYCAMYTRSWDASYATNNGQYDTDGNHYTISYSYTYSNSSDPGAQICDANCMSQTKCPSSSSSTTATTTTTTTTTASSSASATTTTTKTGTNSGTSTTTKSGQSTSTTTSSVAVSSSTTKSSQTSSTTSKCTTSTLTSTTKAGISTTPALSTTKAATTTTPAFVTSTTKAATTTTTTTTTTSSAAPSPTGNCFKVKGSGPNYVRNSYIALSQQGRLAYSSSQSSATIFSLDPNSGKLTVASSGQAIQRTIESWWNPYYGYMSSYGFTPITCTKNKDTTLTCSSFWAAGSVWSSPKTSNIMQGNFPGQGWDSLTLSYEAATCPPGAGNNNGNGKDWHSW